MKTKILYLLLIFSLVSKAQNDYNNIETFREFYIGSNLSLESSSLNGNIIEEIFSGYIDNNLKNRILNLSDVIAKSCAVSGSKLNKKGLITENII